MKRQELFQALLEILKEEIQIYRSFIDLLHEEQRKLIQADMEGIEEVEKKKETVYLKERLLEESRTSLVEKIRATCRLEQEEITLTCIIEMAEGDGQEELSRCQNELKELVTTVSNLCRMNARLIGHSLEFLKGSVSLLNNLTGNCPLYQEDGQFTDGKKSAKLINQKV